MRKRKKENDLIAVFQNYVESNPLPDDWFILSPYFSEEKILFEYQVSALKNALKGLYTFYKTFKGNKQSFARTVYGDFLELLSPRIKNEDIYELLREFYELKGKTLPFEQIANRMSFWMATGSGKTVVIIKLIEILFELMEKGLIPSKPVLFLTAREDLIRAFLKHLQEFNKSGLHKQILTVSLKEYEKESIQGNLFRKIFYYRADLISDEEGDKKLNFRTFLDRDVEGDLLGNWYIILDEAHKGDKEESKRQHLINILSKDGFLFNFSATFTEPIDIATTVFNFNLNEFIRQGYGKQIYLSQSEVKGFEKRKQLREFSKEEKRKIVLKTLILLAGVKKAKEKLPNLYHEPLAVYLVNRVNTEDADLKLLFEELINIAQNIDGQLFENAKSELLEELKNANYLIGNGNLAFAEEILRDLTEEDIYKEVYNAGGRGTIEYEYCKENDEEIALKHTAADKPFALIKIGSVKKIQKSFLWRYQENELFENPKYFENLNKPDSPINILIGSRTFYEGWDSTRPNVITLINLGKQSDAKKFVLQAIGRGLRIEPIKNFRQRLKYILTKIENPRLVKDLKNKVNSPGVKALETLFVFATNKKATRTILEELIKIKQNESYKTVSLYKNPEAEGKLLLIPNYTDRGKKIYELQRPPKFRLSEKNFELLKFYLRKVPLERFVFDWNVSPREFETLKKLIKEHEKFFKFDSNFHYTSPDSLISSLLAYIENEFQELDGNKPFIPLPENAIAHFKDLKVKEEYADTLQKLINEVFQAKPLSDEEKNLTFKEASKLVEKKSSLKREFMDVVVLEKWHNAYYIPLIYAKDENSFKSNPILKPVISVQSEVNFIKTLKRKLSFLDEITDYWIFGKLNEHRDKAVYIPYIGKDGKQRKFIPDFVFWFKLKDSDRYLIYFVDPKGFEHSDYERKIDGYERIFTENGIPKLFSYKNLQVEVRLKFFNPQSDKVSEKYSAYWVDEDNLFEDLKEMNKEREI